MNILGIETSCDETAAAVVQDGRIIRSNIVSSSLKEHKKYGGIIPEIASRRQLECITAVVQQALSDSRCAIQALDAIAVTQRPGLIGSLLVGISYARALSYALKKPLLEVDHIHAHLYANCLNPKLSIKLPALGLVVSGGHSSIFYVKTFRDYELCGETRDDAVGEAFDKVARILELGYPGGPAIDRLAKAGRNSKIRFNCADLPDSYDFSFSGIKTAVLYHHRANVKKPEYSKAEISYAFQESITSTLVQRCISACLKKKVKTLLVGGGVAANSTLREKLLRAAKENNLQVFFPPMSLCMDNAAMIAGLGFHLLTKGERRARHSLGNRL